jgi:hypothetical protein
MASPPRPLLISSPPGSKQAFTAHQPRGGGPANPKKARQVGRLAPKFTELRQALEARRGALQGDAAGVALEQVLVFETNGPVKDLYDSIARKRRSGLDRPLETDASTLTSPGSGERDRGQTRPARGLRPRDRVSATMGLVTRLERFRQYVALMDPSLPTFGKKGSAHASYVESDPRDAIVEELCRTVELGPARRVLAVGCTGSGKTTLVQRCLRRIRDTIKETGDYGAYMDVSRLHRLDDEPLEGVLIAIAGEHLAARIRRAGGTSKDSPRFLESSEAIQRHARGYGEWVDREPDWSGDQEWEPDNDGTEWEHHRGALSSPRDPLRPNRYANLVEPLATLRELAVGEGSHAIFAFDSLDRLAEPQRFSDAVKHDLPVLAAAGIGTIVVGPVRYSIGFDRSVHDLFDSVKVVPSVDTRAGEGRAFLARVLRARDAHGMLPDNVLPKFVEASGGVLRDLMALAQRAGEEAYSRGREAVIEEDVTVAISVLGDALAFGIDDAVLVVLKRLDETTQFVIRGETELALIDQRRVLNIGTGQWAVHPALLPKLRAITGAAA